MIGYVWNKKAKSRKINYEKRNEQIGYNVIKVGINNDTRISGYARMYQQALRCKWTLHQYFTHEKSLVCNAYELSDEHWQSVAEVEAIIRSVCTLSFTTQIDSRLVANASWPNVVKTKIAAKQMTYSVVNIVPSSRSGEQSDKEDGYGGDGQWCRNPTLAKCGGEAQHLEKVRIWSPPGLPNVQSATSRGKTPRLGVFLVSLERS